MTDAWLRSTEQGWGADELTRGGVRPRYSAPIRIWRRTFAYGQVGGIKPWSMRVRTGAWELPNEFYYHATFEEALEHARRLMYWGGQ